MTDDDKNPMGFFQGSDNREPSPELEKAIEEVGRKIEKRTELLDAMSEKNPVRIVGERVHSILKNREYAKLTKIVLARRENGKETSPAKAKAKKRDKEQERER